MERVGGLWRQHNDEGEFVLHSLDDRGAETEIRGIKKPNRALCGTITGWTRQLAMTAGARDVVARHVECRVDGSPRCAWRVRWAAPGDAA